MVKAAIRAYQRYISPDYNSARGSRCAYFPSCSEYTREADSLVDGALRVMGCGADAHMRIARELVAAEWPVIDGDATAVRELASRVRGGDEIAFREEWARLLQDVDVMRYDRPGTDDRQHARYLVRPRFVPSYTPLGPVRRVIAGACGAVVGVVGAALGGALGAVAGLAAGVWTGVSAATGALARLEDRLRPQHGDLAVEKLHDRHAPVSAPVALVARHAGAAPAALLGVAWGLPCGGALGLAAGASVGARMGFALGKNVTAELLGAPPPAHPHDCGCGKHGEVA